MKKFAHYLCNMGFLFKNSWQLAKSRYFFAVLSVALSTFSTFFTLLMPKYIIDELTGGKRWNVVLPYVLLFFGVRLLDTIIWFLFSYWNENSKFVNDFNMKMFFNKFLLNMDYGRFEQNKIRNMGEIIRLNINGARFVDDVVVVFFRNLFEIAGYTYIIFTLHPLIIVFIVVYLYVSKLLSDRGAKLKYDFQKVVVYATRKITYLFKSMISYDFGKETRINNASKWLEKKYDEEVEGYIDLSTKNKKANFRLGFLGSIGSFVYTSVTYGYCSYKVIREIITLGDFTVYLGAINGFTSIISNFISQLLETRYLSTCVDDYKQYVELSTPTHKIKGNITIDTENQTEHVIEFQNVSFKYPNTDNFVLRNISIKIASGERLSIVGYNGSGKSTFIKLICRLYEPTEGVILYNGIDISTIDYDQYRKLLAVVFQDYKLFNFTVAENIVLNCAFVPEKITEAIEKSGLKDKIDGLKYGINTEISKEFNENGIEFSGGEGQKLACARTYYRDAPIVILDEPTASLDPIAESQLYERFNEIIGKKTSIYISHRLASVKFCDNVAVFSDGRIVEYGTHSSLLKKNGVYAQMFHKQASYYQEISVTEVTE